MEARGEAAGTDNRMLPEPIRKRSGRAILSDPDRSPRIHPPERWPGTDAVAIVCRTAAGSARPSPP